jgi:SAM-dependent methyltransferase
MKSATSPQAPHDANIPDYLLNTYHWSYLNPRWVRWLDNDFVVWLLLFGNAGRLVRVYLAEIAPGARVWQVAHVHGSQTVRVARHIGSDGSLTLTDVAPIQIKRARAKLAACPWAQIHCRDAAQFSSPEKFDVVGSFFLLHEVPEEARRQIVDNMLAHVAPGGKAVFMDYHGPAWWQPARLVLKVVNALLEPFANSIWEHAISDYAARSNDFVWTTHTYFGGVYQCTVARRKGQASKKS